MSKQDRKVPRRTLLKGAGVAAGTAIGFPHIVSSNVLAAPGQPGANDRLNVAMIGYGNIGKVHLADFVKFAKKGIVNIAAVCDCDEHRLGKASKVAGPQADVYRDYRYLLERKDIDAILIATPDHWHAVQMVQCCEAGKHVYVEKPACCTIEEGKAMLAAAKRSGVSVQVGSQGRSTPELHAAHRYMANGMLGQVNKVTCWHIESPTDTSPVPDSDPPKTLDWDLWVGPLRWRPYNKKCCHTQFRWLMESGGGQIRDRGAHVMSNAMYLMGADGTGPVTVEATGSPPTRGRWDAAATMAVTYTFKNPDWVMTWCQPGSPVPQEKRRPDEPPIKRDGFGAVYHGDKDRMVVWCGDNCTYAERRIREWEPSEESKKVYESPGHKEDWFEGIKTGKKTIMNIEAGVGVANLCVLGNLSYLLGRKLQWDHAKQEIVGDEQAQRMMSRPQRHPYHT